jgi:cytochrome c-type biogenesis protein CcmF
MNTFGFISLLSATLFAAGAVGFSLLSSRTRLPLALLGLTCAAFVAADGALIWMLWTSDARNAYVVEHSSASMPAAYRLASFWAGQEGSLLLWTSLVAIAAMGVGASTAIGNAGRRAGFTIAAAAALVLTMSIVLIIGADPYRVTDALTRSPTTTTQLRHWAMLIHPPLIFAGYALCAAPFAIVAGGLLANADHGSWIPSMRSWSMAAWMVLGAGIIIGAWWAYTQLGWGGYWAWDPVENASLIPWLTLMALVHALAVHRRRGTLVVWAVFLGLGTFILCAFGTFITRGGLAQSIHSFGRSTIGWHLAAWMLVLVTGALWLVVSHRRGLKEAESPAQTQDGSLIAGIGIFLLVLAAAAVLTGTVTPMIATLVSTRPLWVGPGFYETVVGPLAMAGALMMACAPMIASASRQGAALWQQPLPAIAVGLLVTIACRVAGLKALQPLLFVWIAFVALWFTVGAYGCAVRGRLRVPGTKLVRALVEAFSMQRRGHGTRISHLGVAVLLMGVCTSTVLTRSVDLTLTAGEQVQAGPWKMTLLKVGVESPADGSDDVVIRGDFALTDAAGLTWTMSPRRRHHASADQPMAEVAIRSTWTSDCFVALGDWDDSRGSVGVHVASLPGVLWIWVGAALTAAGGLLCVIPASSRVVVVSETSILRAGEPVPAAMAIPSAGGYS